MPLKGVSVMSVSAYSISTNVNNGIDLVCSGCAEVFVCRNTGIAEGYALDGVSTKLFTVEGVAYEVAPVVVKISVCNFCGDVSGTLPVAPKFFTINRPLFGGALMNGLGEVRVFSSKESAQAHIDSMGEYLGNGESTSGLIVYPVALDGTSGLELD